MNLANKAEVIFKYAFASWVVQLNPSTQHTAMVHTMHTGTSTKNFFWELVRK